MLHEDIEEIDLGELNGQSYRGCPLKLQTFSLTLAAALTERIPQNTQHVGFMTKQG